MRVNCFYLNAEYELIVFIHHCLNSIEKDVLRIQVERLSFKIEYLKHRDMIDTPYLYRIFLYENY